MGEWIGVGVYMHTGGWAWVSGGGRWGVYVHVDEWMGVHVGDWMGVCVCACRYE